MALPFRTARGIVGVVKETTPYAFLEPSNGDSFHAVNIAYNPSQATYKRKDSRAHFGKLPDVPGAAEGDISFEIPIVGAAAATNPFFDACMLGTGHQRGQGVSSAAPAAWVATTVYTAGTIVKTAGNNLYVCNNGGTSGATNPLGTTIGTAITDGTVTWYFIGKQVTAWAATTAYGLTALVTNGGYLYGCTVAGTSASGGPSTITGATTLGAAIVDGTVTWTFLGAANAGAFGSVFYRPTTYFDGSITATLGIVWTNPGEVFSAALWDENSGPRYGLSGCQGDFSLSSKQGEPLIAKFKFHGAYQAIADDATQPVITDSNLIPATLLAAGISIFGNSALAFDGFEFTKGNVLSKRADSNQAAGVRGAWITDQNPSIKVEPEMVKVATLDFASAWRAGTLGAFGTGLIGSVVGNRLAFYAPNCQFSDFNLGDREGARIASMSIAVKTIGTGANGDDYLLGMI